MAVGAEPVIPKFAKGREDVVWVGDVELGKVSAKKQVVIVGAGLTGCEAALSLAKAGKEVTLVVILYEDDHILVLNKPSGTAVHGGSGLSFGVIEGLRALRPEARFLELVHRLDRDTSGVLLVAKKRSALRSLHEQLRDKGMQKDYLALVRGQWQSHTKVVQAPLLKNILQSGERIVRVSQEGKPSETRFKVEERYEFATLVRCSPVTGRTHQIRVHTQYAGHPIAFDDRYGDREFDKQLSATGLNRLFLHAAALKFTHPGSGEVMRVEAPLDNQLKHCLQVLRKSTLECHLGSYNIYICIAAL